MAKIRVTKKALEKALELEKRAGTDIILGAAGPPPKKNKPLTLQSIREWVDECTKCPLWESRTNIVFGEGNEKPRLVFVGEGPGADEDKQGRPFVGRAGQMLNKIIENVFFMSREAVYIANIVKCRPPSNRTPLPDECRTCIPYLHKQLEFLKPEIIVALGTIAAHNLLDTTEAIGKMRGRFHTYRGIRVMPTYHPAYLLRNPADKRKVFEDMIIVREALGIETPNP